MYEYHWWEWEKDGQELWKERVAPIVEGCVTDYEKAKAIYDWECENIVYDYEYKIYDASTCWEQRKGVCEAYSRMFVLLAWGCDLEAEKITGVAKKEKDEGHAWVKVKTEKGWILADPTWGAPSEYAKVAWFDPAPEWALFNHYPDESDDQMLASPITIEQFHNLPNMYNPIGSKFWWNNREFLDYFLNHSGEPYPEFIYGCCQLIDRVRLVEAPVSGNLKIGETYTFKIQCNDTSLLISSNIWNYGEDDWEKEGDVYTKVFQPTSEMIQWSVFYSITARQTTNGVEQDIYFLRYTIIE